jgi:PAS domain S-box-containing protein
MDNEKLKEDLLRKKAEEILKNPLDSVDISQEDEHELRVHQIELEIQNEELRESQRKLEDSQRKYFDLYNFAPVGYFTLDQFGIISEVNIAGAVLLGVERQKLIKTAFIKYIDPDYRNKFHIHTIEVIDTGTKQTVELKLLNPNINSFYVHLETINAPYENGSLKEFRIIVTDINELKNTEKALVESEGYRDIFVNDHTVMMLIDPNSGDIVNANPAASNFYGYSLDELLKMKISDLNISDKDFVIKEMQKALSKEKNYFIFKHRLSNGKIRDVDVCSGVINQNGKNLLYSIVNDITSQKQAEEELRESEELFRLIFDQSPIGSTIITIDYTPLQVNNALSDILGYSKDELLTMKFPEYTHPDDIKLDTEQKNLLASGEIDNFVIEKRYIHKNGEIIWGRLHVSAVKNQSGTTIRFLAMVEDITKNKKIEDQITFQANLLSRVHDAIVAVDENYNIIYWNKMAEDMFGWTREEVLGKNSGTLFKTKIENSSRDECIEKLIVEGQYYGEVQYINKDGSYIPVDVRAGTFKDAKGKLNGTITSIRDITKRKLDEKKLKNTMDKLEYSNKELEHFAYVASHDLREPLRMITTFLQLLERRYSDQLDKDANEFIGFAVDGAKRLNEMINDLLEYSKVTSKEIEIHPVNIETILKNILINIKVQIDENKAVITHDPLPIINCDENLIFLLLQNLIANAIKYRGIENPKIHISIIKQKEQYLFSVKDNGIGIDPEHLERIFTIFQRLHPNHKYEGTGIGLAIAHKIVEQHNGKIWAKSQQGKGTTFYFTIPI